MERERRAIPNDYGLTQLLFCWSLEDIYNEDLYRTQVEEIPASFRTVDHYLRSYMYPLLEDMRAEMCSSVEDIHRAPFAEVISFSESNSDGKLFYDVMVDRWRNRFSDRDKEPYRTSPGDIFFLTDAKPETVSDLQRVGRTWTYALVTKIPQKEDEDEDEDNDEDDDLSTYFEVKISENYEVNDAKQSSMFVVFLINIITNRRIWKALHMYRNMRIINKVLSSDSLFKENCHQCPKWSDGGYAENFALSSNLNESQTKAISSCLEKVHCNHKPSVELIWGPPGTGKTRTVSVLLSTLLRMNIRTLTCAPTNIAIAEVVSRVLKLRKESFENGLGANGLFCSLGDILLFGNKYRLKSHADIEEVYLDYRVDRLIECFGPVTGWRYRFNSIIDFLEDCVSHYHIFLENELSKEKSCSNEDGSIEEEGFMKDELISNESENAKKVDKSFIEFLRDRFRAIVRPLRRCVSIFCTHLSKNFIGEQNLLMMVDLLQLLDSFESLLSEDNLVPEELEQLFSYQEVVQDSFSDSSNLFYMHRRECLSLLKTLRSSLNGLHLPGAKDKGLIKKFCFKMASLIFCTASSSYKLYRVKMKPLDLLVIDEAAQLKECESAIPLQLPDIRHAILIGDECQLPAMLNSKVSEEAGFGRSLFERLSLLGHFKHLLNVQYRMHPSISFFPNSKFYLNQILDAPNVKRKNHTKHYLSGPMFGSYSFINVRGKEEHDDVGKSRKNMIEVAIVIKIVGNLYKEWSGSNEKLCIGVISPYAAQVVTIQDKLGEKYENLDNFVVKVKTVDGFQAGEEDIIIISTVRANAYGAIGFLSNPQRTNVALTRARHCLWILGNERTLANSESVWEDLVRDAKKRKRFFNADENKDMAKAILEVKMEFDQLDRLLDGSSILFKSARWKVLFSNNFRKSFVKLRSDRTKKSVMNLLLNLSSGWRPKRLNIDRVCESSSQILKQFKVEGLYIVCSIDLVKHTQVLKVWDILPLEDIPKLVKRLDNIFQRYTDDFINRCKEKCLDGNLEVPRTWTSSSDIVQFKNFCKDEYQGNENADASDDRCYVENSKVSESLLLMKFYSLSSGMVRHLLSDQDGSELDLPFEVTDQEQDIIISCRSSFILGRSGTGKTTVLTMKLFQKEQQHHMAMEGFQQDKGNASTNATYKNEVGTSIGKTQVAVLRQIFVTVSPKLCYAVKQNISRLKSFAHGEKHSAESNSNNIDYVDDAELFNDIQNSLVDIPPKSYPLVVTFHKFLMMLDGTLGNSYFERLRDVREFSHGRRRSLSSIGMQTFIRTKEVTYDKFASSYWPHFNSKLTNKLDSSRVFTEIISHIKGGLEGGRVPDGKLSQEDYVLLSEGRVSTLRGQERQIIYIIFQDYEKMKMEKGEFDLADLVIDLHRRLKHERYMGDEMDFVYIDEVQDLTMRQIALFKYICRNVNEGFVFSGDTAQTIARGIDFRFQDIRLLFYSEFVMKSSDGKKEKGQISENFHLSQNFRTHAGVLKLAQSVIDLLYRFFPQSVDILSPETSLIYGEAPVLLEPGENENAIITMFGNTQNVGGNMFGFGAEQVILVRDDSARKEISDHVGKQALVLTILECKGLEFQDVLLYNFFGSSPLKDHWRVIYEYMKEQDLLDPAAPSPHFSQSKHNLLCSELKQLYVAITRTRQRMWICENIEECSKPMFDYWKKLCLVQVTKLNESLANAMQVASTPEEWKATGMKLLREHHYEMATRCFERAEDTYWARLAKAYGLKAAAEQKCDLNLDAAHVDLRKAAEIFEDIGQAYPAAQCYFELNEYERAGRIYMDKCGEAELEKAGECFSLAGLYERAAEVYARGHFISECLSTCTKGKLFDMGLRYIQYWKQVASTNSFMIKRSKEMEKIEQEFLESCACHYHELKDNRTMMKFVKAFHSMESKRNFLTTLDCLSELLRLEEELGNFLEAAKIAKLSGEILLEAEMLGKAGKYIDASSLLLSFVFSNSLWASGSSGWPLKQFVKKEEILTKARLFAERKSKYLYELVCMEASILSDEQISLSKMNQCLSASQRHKSVRGEILSARKFIDAHLNSNTTEYEWIDEWVYDLKQHSEERLSQNCISVETLLYFWDIWKGNIVNILEFLGVDETQDAKDYSGYEEFCLNYLGVRKQSRNLNVIYALLNPDANWVREVDDKFIQRTGRLVYLDGHQFASAAQRYWSSELFSVGTNVLENLKVLYNNSTEKSLSLFCQSKLLIHQFEVAKFLLKFKFLDRRCNPARPLQKFLDGLTEQFCSKVFPLDWKKSSTENMVFLRETNLSRLLFEEAISTSISMKNGLTYGHIGSVASWILGTGKLTVELYEKIAERFSGNPPMKAFIRNLSRNIRSGSPEGSVLILESQKYVSLVLRLDEAVRDIFNANWRQSDYISPVYFMYLVDHLLILATSSQGYCFTTKSSYIEWLIFHEWNSSPCPGFVANQIFPFEETLDHLAYVAQQFLYNKHDTVEWIRKSNINLKEYYPLLLLRLVIIICLLCVNGNVNDGKYVEIIFHLLERSDITSQLPREFCDVLWRRRKRNQFSINLNVLAEAFRKVDNPLVIVKLQRDSSRFLCPDAIFIDMTVDQSRQNLLQILFQRSIHSTSTKLPSNSRGFSNSSSRLGWALKSQNDEFIGGSPKNNYEHFWDFLCALDRKPMKNFLPNVPKVKLELEDNIRLITSVLATFPEGEDVDLCQELNFMLEELRQLSSMLNMRNNSSRVGELVMRLKSRRPRVEPLLNRLFLQKDSTAASEASSATTTIPSEIQNQVDKGKARDEEVNTKTSGNSNNRESESESQKGQGKGKGKKGKKGKGRRK